jgi:hypothetical protein
MRTLRLLPVIAALWLSVSIACQKAKVIPAPASVTVVHAMAGGNAIVPKFGDDTAGRYYKGPTSGNTMVKVNYMASQLYSRVAGPTSLSVVPVTDTLFRIFNGSVDLQSGSIYSFFLSGDTAHADTTFVVDNIPYYADSSAGARFINLAVGGKAIAITLAGDITNTPITTLGYRQNSGFIKYPATVAAGSSYKFTIRDQATGDSLTSYTWSYPRFKNSTIVIAGSTDPAPPPQLALKVFSVANY